MIFLKAKEHVLYVLNHELNVDNISTSWHNEKLPYPQITVTQTGNNVLNSHDNKVDFRVVSIQIDVWSNENPFFIAEEVEKAMLKHGHVYKDEIEVSEPDVNRILLEYEVLEKGDDI